MASPSRLRLFRTTGFKLSLIYLAVFSVFALVLLGYIATSTNALLNRQINEAVDAEIGGLAEQYAAGGITRLVRVIERRSLQPGASLYLLMSFNGVKLVGNVESVPEAVIDHSDPAPQIVPYARIGDTSTARYPALVRVFTLPGGFRLLVGRDVSEMQMLSQILRRALFLTAATMLVLGLITWLFVTRRVLKRIDSIADTSRGIVAGDLSGRLEVTGTGDEFDRLAESLNDMLDRIERLMLGLKQVSDNIAHDLKTPLTRLRNRVDSALAQARSDEEYREALQATIEEADHLIRTFNALLMIARVEAGSSDAEFRSVDVVAVARDVFDLYEPLAEEAGVEITLTLPESAVISGNRELVGQALANLVDNAIKYSAEAAEDKARIDIAISEEAGRVVLSVADNGAGIASQDRARATKRFVRLEESRSKPGAGLGLSLVAAVAQLHGGALRLEDNAPGLRAMIELPREDAGRGG